MTFDHYRRYDLACAPFFVRKRVGKSFKVLCRFRTYRQALDCLNSFIRSYPGIYFDIKDVSFSHLDKESSL